MAIIDDLNKLQANILTAKQVLAYNISSKGVGVSFDDTLTSLANSVSKIEQGSGGSGQWVLPDGISFTYSTWVSPPKDVENADASKLTTMRQMFAANTGLTSLDLTSWNISNVKDMYQTFTSCPKLTTLKLSGLNTSKVNNMEQMFNNCTSLTELDLSGWDVRNVTNMGSLFARCNSLKTINVSGWDTLNVPIPSSGKYIFGTYNVNSSSNSSIYGNLEKLIISEDCSDEQYDWWCNRLTESRIDCSIIERVANNKVNSLSCNFDKSTLITDLYFDIDNLPEAEGYWWVGFSYNPNQKGDCNNCSWTDSNLRICLYENRYEGIMDGQITDLEQVNGLYHLHLVEPLYFKCGEVNAHLERYYLTTNKSASCDDTISFRWDGNATDSFEFELEMRTRNIYREDCKDNGDGTYTYTTTLSDMGIDNLTYCSYAFTLSRYLVELIKFPCTDNVTTMENMFSSSQVFYLDLSSFNVSNVTSMRNMFSNCSNLKTLNLNGWKLNDMVDTDRMFNYCDNLREIYLKNSDETTHMKIQDALYQSGINAEIITE